MRSFRYRPFGLAGSLLEVLVGFELLRGIIWTDEDYGLVLMIVNSAIGGLVLLAGLVGVVYAARQRRRRSVG